MKKQILNLEGVVALTKQQQKSILGGNGKITPCYVTCSDGRDGAGSLQNCSSIPPSICSDGATPQTCECKEVDSVLNPPKKGFYDIP